MTTMTKDNYNGSPRGERIYTLCNDSLRADISNIGASIAGLYFKKNGVWREMTLGFDRAEDRIAGGSYGGATIGRVSGRIGGARFTLEGKVYNLSANEGSNCLHGGAIAFDRLAYDCRQGENELEFTLVSADGDMGFPGKMRLKVQYVLEGSSLTINYFALSNKTTLWAPTCHTYFSLDGRESKNCLTDMLKINADSYVELGEGMLPTGRVKGVEGTPFDFRNFHAVGERIHADDEGLKLAGGYDHTFITGGGPVAEAYGANSGIRLQVYSDMPAVQLYSGNYLGGRARGNVAPFCCFALEPQFVPNAVNMQGFEVPVLEAGQEKSHYIRYKFQ